MVTRNFIYPAYVAGSVHRHCNFPDGRKMPDEETNFWFQVTLWTLEVLHVYWAILILRMVYKAIRDSGVKDDIRNVKHEKDE